MSDRHKILAIERLRLVIWGVAGFWIAFVVLSPWFDESAGSEALNDGMPGGMLVAAGLVFGVVAWWAAIFGCPASVRWAVGLAVVWWLLIATLTALAGLWVSAGICGCGALAGITTWGQLPEWE